MICRGGLDLCGRCGGRDGRWRRGHLHRQTQAASIVVSTSSTSASALKLKPRRGRLLTVVGCCVGTSVGATVGRWTDDRQNQGSNHAGSGVRDNHCSLVVRPFSPLAPPLTCVGGVVGLRVGASVGT